METGLTTSRGGKISVHFGSICTTNLWKDKWYEITDLMVIQKMQTIAKYNNHPADWMQLRNDYPDPDLIGHPYTRPGMNTLAPTPSQPQSQLQTVDDYATMEYVDEPEPQPEPEPEIPDETKIRMYRVDAVNGLRRFFSEFKFSVAARFVNTLCLQPDDKAAREYISGYVSLINHPDATSIKEKLKSSEFDVVLEGLTKYPPEKPINSRLTIYFGDAGTGKTTEAMREYPEACIVPCNASILPDELLRTFDFNDDNGNPVFKPSDLRRAMEEGKPIIFDEINLLSFESLRLLQTLTDNKDRINYNGETIEIKPGFKIIGTMNLVVNDQVYSLPDPLVDRAAVIKQFDLSDENLADYAFGA